MPLKRMFCAALIAALSFVAFAAAALDPIVRVARDAFVTVFAEASQRFSLFVRTSEPLSFGLALARARAFRSELLARQSVFAFGTGLAAV